MGGTEIKVVSGIFLFLLGLLSKFGWNKIQDHERRHDNAEDSIKELDNKISERMAQVENRATAMESSIVTKDDLFNAINTINEQASKRDEKIYEKLGDFSSSLAQIKVEIARSSRRGQHRQSDDDNDMPRQRNDS